MVLADEDWQQKCSEARALDWDEDGHDAARRAIAQDVGTSLRSLAESRGAGR